MIGLRYRGQAVSFAAYDVAGGVTDQLWEVADLVALLEASERGLERAA